jgi:RND family efflux transporter MFP subunit
MPANSSKHPISRLVTLSAAMLGPTLALTLLLAGCGQDKPKAKAEAPGRPVLVQAVRYAPLQANRTFVATIKPRVEADLGFRVAGKVLKRSVDVGATVKAGDLLAVMDETDLRLQFEQAQAEVRAATVAQANADTEYQRRLTLNKQGYLSTANLDQQKTLADEARSRLDKGERALKLAQNALGYSRLVSDADGVVTTSVVEPGQVVAAGQVVMRVARTAEREALAAIPETLVERIRTGSATLALWSSPDKSTRAILRELSPAADAATRTYAARFSLPDAGAEMAWGMTATLTVADAVTATAARLPLSALFNEGKGPSLWVVDKASGALTLKPVDVAKVDGNSVYVRSGVSEGDDVVTLGVQKLDPGQKVRVVSALGT